MSSRRHRRESDRPEPSGPPPIEPKSNDPSTNGPQPNRPRPSGPRDMNVRPTGQRNVDPQPTEPGPSGPRIIRGPRTNEPRLTSDQPQPGASGVEEERQNEIMRLSKKLAEIRVQIETIYPMKAAQEKKVDSQKGRISQMARENRSSRDIRKATEELEGRKATLEETVGKLEKARAEDEQVFMERWCLQYRK